MPITLRKHIAAVQLPGMPAAVYALQLSPRSLAAVTGGVDVALPTVTALDAQGNHLTGRTVTWAIRSGSAYVGLTQDGHVHPNAAGPAVLRATCEGVTVDCTVTVITSPAPGPYAGAMYVPLYDLPHRYDDAGNDLGPLRYNTQTGSATDDRVFDASYASAVAKIAAAPVFLTATTDRDANHAALQAAVDAAGNYGRRIRLQRFVDVAHAAAGLGADWGGELVLPNRSRTSSAPILIEDERLLSGTFPVPDGTRLRDSDVAALPKLTVNGNHAAVWLMAQTANIRFEGIDFTFAAGFDPGPYDDPGAALNSGQLNWGFVFASSNTSAGDLGGRGPQGPDAQNPLNMPYGITFGRSAVHGGLGKAWKFGLRLSGARLAAVGCRVYDIGCTVSDSCGVFIEHGPGPVLRENNYVATSCGENMMLGGTGGGVVATIPTDVQDIRNHLKQGWLGLSSAQPFHKCLWECKEGVRVLLEDNLLDGYVGNGRFGQQYYAVNVKSHDQQTGDNPGLVRPIHWTHDVTVRRNRGINSYGGVAVPYGSQGRDEYQAYRVEVAHNLWQTPDVTPMSVGLEGRTEGSLMQLFGSSPNAGPDDLDLQVHDVTVRQNTMSGPHTQSTYQVVLYISDAPNAPGSFTNNRVIDNVFVQPGGSPFASTYFRNDGPLIGTARQAWAAFVASGRVRGTSAVTGNLIANVAQSACVDGDTGAASIAALQLDPTSYAPLPGSPALTGATHGGLRGCDVSLLSPISALQG